MELGACVEDLADVMRLRSVIQGAAGDQAINPGHKAIDSPGAASSMPDMAFKAKERTPEEGRSQVSRIRGAKTTKSKKSVPPCQPLSTQTEEVRTAMDDVSH